MKILRSVERKFGKYAIKDLMLYIVGLNGVIYLLSYVSPETGAAGKLMLDPALVMNGEIWRLVTFVLIPPQTSILWIFFILALYYTVGAGLEAQWGSFMFNIYYLTGMAATVVASFITGQGATALYLNLSLFLAFAYVYPDFELLLFFVLPVKVKYLAWLQWLYILFTVVSAPLAAKAAALASIVNYFLFFGADILAGLGRARSAHNWKHKVNAPPLKPTFHRCFVCGRTEKDGPSLEFRYCSTCEGDYEYCMDHLKTHEHKKKVPAGQE